MESSTERVVLLYKIQFRLGSVVRTLTENTIEKYYEINNKSKNLIWSLLIQGLLNDNKIENIQYNYGKNLVIEADFNEILKNIGLKKIDKKVIIGLKKKLQKN